MAEDLSAFGSSKNASFEQTRASYVPSHHDTDVAKKRPYLCRLCSGLSAGRVFKSNKSKVAHTPGKYVCVPRPLWINKLKPECPREWFTV